MAEFINTIDALGENAVIDSIIDRSITEFKDDVITTLRGNAFRDCKALASVELPNCTRVSAAFQYCSALQHYDFSNVTYVANQAFLGCKLGEVYIPTDLSTDQHAFNSSGITGFYAPNMTKLNNMVFYKCGTLKRVEAPKCTSVGSSVFAGCSLLHVDLDGSNGINFNSFEKAYCTNLKTLIIRSANTVPSMNTLNFGTLTRFYVARDLIEQYKVATNWSTYADQLRPLEDYTDDGTITGNFVAVNVDYYLRDVTISNTETAAAHTYHATLSSDQSIVYVCVTMGGVDVTDIVYNAESGEINISNVTGDIHITAKTEIAHPLLYELPLATKFNGSSDYIDTGIKLFDTEKDFTILCVADFSKLNGSNETLMYCQTESSPYPGLSVVYSNGITIGYTGSSYLTTKFSDSVYALAIRYKAGVIDTIRYKNAAGELVTVSHNTSAKYTVMTRNLLLGSYLDRNNKPGRFYDGTIKDFLVYEAALTDEELVTEIESINYTWGGSQW